MSNYKNIKIVSQNSLKEWDHAINVVWAQDLYLRAGFFFRLILLDQVELVLELLCGKQWEKPHPDLTPLSVEAPRSSQKFAFLFLRPQVPCLLYFLSLLQNHPLIVTLPCSLATSLHRDLLPAHANAILFVLLHHPGEGLFLLLSPPWKLLLHLRWNDIRESNSSSLERYNLEVGLLNLSIKFTFNNLDNSSECL